MASEDVENYLTEEKFLTMWLGNTMDVPTYDLGSTGSIISLVHSMKLLGVTIDKDLNFTEHTAYRVSGQIQVMRMHMKLINTDIKIKLYNSYLLPNIYY